MLASQWNQVIAADLRKVLREPFFWFIMIAPILLAWGLREFLPYATGEYQNFDLPQYYPLILALLILTAPLYYGMVLGLQVLEEKDEKVLLAVAVTPLQLHRYLAARIAMFTLISIPLIVLVHEIIDVIEIGMGRLIWVALAASLNTPLMTLLLAAFAKNQLEGFVMVKGLGFIILFPLAMFFVPAPWHLLCSVLPTYWPIMAYFTAAAEAGSVTFFYFDIVMAVIAQLLATLLLYRKFATGLLSS